MWRSVNGTQKQIRRQALVAGQVFEFFQLFQVSSLTIDCHHISAYNTSAIYFTLSVTGPGRMLSATAGKCTKCALLGTFPKLLLFIDTAFFLLFQSYTNLYSCFILYFVTLNNKSFMSYYKKDLRPN